MGSSRIMADRAHWAARYSYRLALAAREKLYTSAGIWEFNVERGQTFVRLSLHRGLGQKAKSPEYATPTKLSA